MSFREINVPTEPKNAKSSQSTEKIKEKLVPIDHPTDAPDEPTDLLATYKDETGKPYTADYFGIEELYNEPELSEPLGIIEEYLQEQVVSKKLANTTTAGKKFLKELEKGAKTNDMDDTDRRMDKIIAYIEFKKVIDG